MVVAQGQPQLKNVESVCLQATRCDERNFNECASYDVAPLVRVHRAFLELKQSVTSDQLFIEECFEVPGVEGNFCVPFPLRGSQPSEYRIANYKADSPPLPILLWNTGGKELVQTTLKQMCLASYVNPTQGESYCNAEYGPGGLY